MQPKRRTWKRPDHATFMLALALIVALMVRFVWSATAPAMVATLALWTFTLRRRDNIETRLLRRIGWITAVAVLVIVVTLGAVLGTSGRAALGTRLRSLANPAHGSASGRLFIWRTTLQMARASRVVVAGRSRESRRTPSRSTRW